MTRLDPNAWTVRTTGGRYAPRVDKSQAVTANKITPSFTTPEKLAQIRNEHIAHGLRETKLATQRGAYAGHIAMYLMAANGWSMAELAERSDVSQSTISHACNNRCVMNAQAFGRLCALIPHDIADQQH